MAVDWIGRNLYWVDSSLDTLEVASLNPPYHRTILIAQNLSQPRGLALDPRPNIRFLFWTDWGIHPSVQRSDLDGQNRKILVNTKIFWPNTLTLDLPTQRVYFADSKLDYIEFIDYQGNNRRRVISGSKASKINPNIS